MSRAGDRHARADVEHRKAVTGYKTTEAQRGGRDHAGRAHAADKNTSKQDAKEAARQDRGH